MFEYIPQLELEDKVWVQVRDGNLTAWTLFQRHYSKYHYKDGRRPKRFVGPGRRIVLISQNGDALFVWRSFRDSSGQHGFNCSVFRNESKKLSSELILEAEQILKKLWGHTALNKMRLYTYINAQKIRSTNPGYCFKVAGWKKVGITQKNKLIILAKEL